MHCIANLRAIIHSNIRSAVTTILNKVCAILISYNVNVDAEDKVKDKSKVKDKKKVKVKSKGEGSGDDEDEEGSEEEEEVVDGKDVSRALDVVVVVCFS